MPLSVNSVLYGIAQSAWEIFALAWWIIVPITLLFIFWDMWMLYIVGRHLNKIKWILLEIKVPKNIQKTPKAMEQVFAAVHATYSFGVKPVDKYWRGKVEDWMSFEITGDANGIRFFIRTAEGFRDLLESAIYAQYPDAEISIVDDYTNSLPSVLPNNNYDLFGSDFILEKENAYPIKTYPQFDSIAQEEKLDTIANITELMSRLSGEGRIWLQLLIRPTGNSWKKKAEKIRDKLLGRKETQSSFMSEVWNFFINFIMAPFRAPQWPIGEKQEKPSFGSFSKGEQEVIKAVEEKVSKIGFESVLRFLYIDDKNNFSRNNISAVMGSFRQFNTLNLNGIRPNISTMTITVGLFKSWFKKQRVYFKKRKIYDNYVFRIFPPEFSILNTEELATLYHFPSEIVKAPMLHTPEFKKGAPPPNLPAE